MANPNQASGNPGSANVPAPNPSNQGVPAGQTNQAGGTVDYEKAYKELEKRLGEQGNELGEYKTFFGKISPLLEKLDQQPELAQAIVDGKITGELAKAVSEGRVDVKDAAVVQQAHDEVKKQMGDKAYEAATPDQIEKLVEGRVEKLRKDLEEKAEIKEFEAATTEFINKTPDFSEYAEAIDKWLDEHDVTDIKVAYYAVKGEMSEAAARKKAEEASGEAAKDVVANAAGGGQRATQMAPNSVPDVDRLIAGAPNPNRFLGGF